MRRRRLEGDWKLLEFERPTRFSLYDLADDPGELRDVSEHFPDRVASLAKELEDYKLANTPRGARGQKVELSEEQREALEALGY